MLVAKQLLGNINTPITKVHSADETYFARLLCNVFMLSRTLVSQRFRHNFAKVLSFLIMKYFICDHKQKPNFWENPMVLIASPWFCSNFQKIVAI